MYDGYVIKLINKTSVHINKTGVHNLTVHLSSEFLLVY